MLGCAAGAFCIDLSRFHEGQHADALLPVMVSLYEWQPFYWEQDRLGMLLPALALPFRHPLANLLVQNGLAIFGGLASFGILARYLVRDATWVGIGAGGAIVFLLAFPVGERFQVLNGAQPYPIAVLLALGGILVAAGTGRPVARVLAAMALTLLAYWYNAGIGVVIAPLVAWRFAASWIRGESKWREGFIATLLTACGTVCGRLLMALADSRATNFTLSESSTWPCAWHTMAMKVYLRFEGYFEVLAALAAIGLLWLAIPATRAAAAKCWLILAVVVAWVLSQGLFAGTTTWAVMNNYDARYLYPGLMGLAMASVGVAVGPLLALRPRLSPVWVLIALPLAAVCAYGTPSVAAARASIDNATGRWTNDILDGGCTHVVGEYWHVWPATFHANMTLADRGDPRILWAVAFRSRPTHRHWLSFPQARMRLGVLKTEPSAEADLHWRWVFPTTVCVETRPTLEIHRPVVIP